jgi:hypothetical protein
MPVCLHTITQVQNQPRTGSLSLRQFDALESLTDAFSSWFWMQFIRNLYFENNQSVSTENFIEITQHAPKYLLHKHNPQSLRTIPETDNTPTTYLRNRTVHAEACDPAFPFRLWPLDGPFIDPHARNQYTGGHVILHKTVYEQWILMIMVEIVS